MKLKINTILETDLDKTFPSDLTVLPSESDILEKYLLTVEDELRLTVKNFFELHGTKLAQVFFVGNSRALAVINNKTNPTREDLLKEFFKIYDYVRYDLGIINTITSYSLPKISPKEWTKIVLQIVKKFNHYNSTVWHAHEDIFGNQQPEPDFSRSYLCTKEITFLAATTEELQEIKKITEE